MRRSSVFLATDTAIPGAGAVLNYQRGAPGEVLVSASVPSGNDYAAAVWTKTACDATVPNVLTATGASSSISQTSGLGVSTSDAELLLDLSHLTVAWCCIDTTNSAAGRTWIDLVNWVTGTVGTSHHDIVITDLGGGVRRVTMTVSGTSRVQVRLTDGDGSLVTTAGLALGLANVTLTQLRCQEAVCQSLGYVMAAPNLNRQPLVDAKGWIKGNVYQTAATFERLLWLETANAAVVAGFNWTGASKPFSIAVVREVPTPPARPAAASGYPLGTFGFSAPGLDSTVNVGISELGHRALYVKAVPDIEPPQVSLDAAVPPSLTAGIDLWIWDGTTLTLYDENGVSVPLTNTVITGDMAASLATVSGDYFASALGACVVYPFALGASQRASLLTELAAILPP